MITDAHRYAVKKEGAKGLRRGFDGWSNIAWAKKLRWRYNIAGGRLNDHSLDLSKKFHVLTVRCWLA